MLHCQQYPRFLSHLGDSEMKNSIKAGFSLMLENSSCFDEGKSLILKAVNSKLNYFLELQMESLIVMQLHENSGFLFDFTCVDVTDTTDVYITSLPKQEFSKDWLSNHIFVYIQYKEYISHVMGYCGTEFPSKPPQKAQCTITDEINATACTANSARDQFYACKGKSKVLSCLFTNKSPSA